MSSGVKSSLDWCCRDTTTSVLSGGFSFQVEVVFCSICTVGWTAETAGRLQKLCSSSCKHCLVWTAVLNRHIFFQIRHCTSHLNPGLLVHVCFSCVRLAVILKWFSATNASEVIYYVGTTSVTILLPLYRSTCFSWHLQLRTGGFCWCKVLLPACPCWWQTALLD